MNTFQKLNKLLLDFKIDKRYWSYDSLTGEDYDIRRSKPAPFIKKTIEIAKLLNLQTVVEIGSTRSRAGFTVHTVDIDPNCLNGVNWCYSNIGEQPPPNLNVHIPQDGISFLKNFNSNIDVLYLDGWDKGTPNFAENHLEAYFAAKDKLSNIHLILIDDTDFVTQDGGKDKLLSPLLVNEGYTLLFNGRQTLFLHRI